MLPNGLIEQSWDDDKEDATVQSNPSEQFLKQISSRIWF